MTVNDATRAQIRAANPLASTWLTANAGSGKTKVLTDRVARLLLLGVDPQSILCLTYTKAAAAEMQNRLFRRLGAWAMMADADLTDALGAAGVEGVPDLAQARTLFARAIEVPGGLKIQTIHAFAAAILRRFPMEAGISPDFREIDDDEAETLRKEVVDQIAAERLDIVTSIARFTSDDDLDALAMAVADKRETFPDTPSREALAASLGVDPDLSEKDLVDELLGSDGRETLASLMPALATGSTNDLKALQKLSEIDLENIDPSAHTILDSVLLFGEGAKAPFGSKSGKFPTAATRKALGPAADALDAMMDRAEALRETRLALEALEQTLALQEFAAVFLPAYARAKAARGALDFDDLIARADALLSDYAVANWVLYRIDGDIEHVLVDEAQDTSPAQWRLIEKLTQELTAGQGAETRIPRSIFVVGDIKQSIYSFQGADPREMARMADHYRSRLGGALSRSDLQFSFRSSSAILRVVDQTFAPLAGQGIGDGAVHYAFHDSLPGRVDLWPIEEPAEKPDDPDWHDPCDIVQPTDPVARLSHKIAQEIAKWIETETIPAENGMSRPVRPQDILILFKSRNSLFHQTIRACKEAGLAVAGADRILLQDELAVQDIISVLSFLALPEDDLALAEALRSPLFDWSEDDLFRLAHGRGQAYLWQTLREKKAGHPETLAVLNDLRDQADFLRPFEIIDRLLTRHGGRSRLLARLGNEAEEGIDALLGQAMRYEERGAPSLTGFLAWYAAGEIEIKRQSGAADAGIRIMTVHGAKGLESPIVILPDTLSEGGRTDTLVAGDDDTHFFHAAKSVRPAAVDRAVAARTRVEAEERQRLLYVAMTRAETWLVVAGAGAAPKKGETWYERVAAGLDGVGATLTATLADGTQIRRHAEGQWDRPSTARPARDRTMPETPEWLDTRRGPPAKDRPVLPSDLGGLKALPGEDGADTEDALAYGSALHLLLERLPNIAAADRPAAAAQIVAGTPPDLAEQAVATALDLLGRPGLSELFGAASLAEVDIAARPVAFGGRLLTGSIDRLIVRPDSVLAVDFKSNRVVPARPEDTPGGILRQMAAYAAALAEIYPTRRIDTAILWTETGLLMPLPHDIVRDALQNPAIS